MVELYKPKEHNIKLGISIIKQVVQNRSHPLDVIREALSNACSQEVESKQVILSIFYDPTYGWSLQFEDDGVGMDYTGEDNPEKKGRLDKFLDLAYSGAAGLDVDEFSWKGLGAKLMYLCKRLEIETKTESGKSYKVIVDNPQDKLLKEKPELPEPKIYEDSPVTFSKGTSIRVYGYDGGIKYEEYENLDKLKNFLYFRTVVGCTIPERIETLPKIVLNTPNNQSEKLELGYRWVKKTGNNVQGQVIGLIEPPIKITKTDNKGNKVTIILKGGYALKTGEFDIAAWGISGGGLQYVWKGIPYFHLDYNRFRSATKLEIYGKLARFTVECEDVDTNMSRSELNKDGIIHPLFESAVLEAFRKIKDTGDYKFWVQSENDRRKSLLAGTLNDRKVELQKSSQKYVYWNGGLIHKVPSNEKDTLALLWKLEALRAIPFFYFKTLEHTSQIGIDVIGEYQETEHSAKEFYRSIEVEYFLESYGDHEHSPEQTAMIIAWDSENKDDLEITEKPYKFIWTYSGCKLLVYLIKHFPGIGIDNKK